MDPSARPLAVPSSKVGLGRFRRREKMALGTTSLHRATSGNRCAIVVFSIPFLCSIGSAFRSYVPGGGQPLQRLDEIDVSWHQSSSPFDAFDAALRASLRDARLRKRLEDYNLFHTETNGASEPAGTWYQNNVEPSFACAGEERLGKQGDGGKWVCNPGELAKKPTCLVYSIGSNNKFDFESALLDNVSKNCEIHVFDHTVSTLRLVSKQRKPWRVHFHQIGLAAMTSRDAGGDFKTLSDMVRDLGHVGRTIDILKIDCEGCEWTTFASWFDAPVKISQILVEVHSVGTVGSKNGSSNDEDDAGTFPPAKHFFQRLHDENFAIFHKEANIQWTAFENLCLEFSLVRLPDVPE